MRACGVYFRGDDIYVCASAKNTFGILKDWEPFFKLTQPVSPMELGKRVLDALAAYRDGVPGEMYVKGVKRPVSPFLVFSGFRSWKSFERGATYFSVSNFDSEVTITPSIAAPKGGYLHQPEHSISCARLPGEIGSLLIERASKS